MESALLCVGFLLIPLWPRCAVMTAARALGCLGFTLARSERRIALANVDLAFGDTLTAAEKAAIVRCSFQSMARVMLDYFWFSLWTRRRILRHVTFESSLDPFLANGAVIAVTAHFGNWEVMGQAAAVHGAPTLSIAAPIKNPFADRVVSWFRRTAGQTVAYRKGAVRAMIQELKKGGRVALLMDQNIPVEEGGVFVPFFGLPVPVSKIIGPLASKTNALVMFCFSSADRQGHYRIYSNGSVGPGVLASEAEAVTATLTLAIEAAIRDNPGEWLWMYRRWRHIPEGAPAERYPYYARRLKPA